jgi:hypothetical protein
LSSARLPLQQQRLLLGLPTPYLKHVTSSLKVQPQHHVWMLRDVVKQELRLSEETANFGPEDYSIAVSFKMQNTDSEPMILYTRTIAGILDTSIVLFFI